jgi:hypothetical protein
VLGTGKCNLDTKAKAHTRMLKSPPQAMYCRLPVSLEGRLPSPLSRTLGPGAAVGAGGIDRFDPPAQGVATAPQFYTPFLQLLHAFFFTAIELAPLSL